MNKIATLGPKGTYSGLAALKFIEAQNNSYEIEYFGSIKKTLKAIDENCELVVLPIENFSEGYVSLVLDHIIENELLIVSEVILPIQFSLISNMDNLSKVNQLFVQFVAKGQCSEYIDSINKAEIVTTESNIESLHRVIKNPNNSAAIVPYSSFDPSCFNTVIENVNDHENNQTRFLVLSKKPEVLTRFNNIKWKTSLVIFDENDHPGMLAEVLASFASKKINLTSIISRPTKIEFGQYNFFIDIDGHIKQQCMLDALKEIKKNIRVKVLGSYQVVDTTA